jgi:hypothetical protein
VARDQWCSLCHAPVQPTAHRAGPTESASTTTDLIDAKAALPVPPSNLNPERVDQLLERLAAAETRPDPRSQLGVLANLHGRAGGLLLAGVLGLILLAGGMLSLYLLGSLI